MTRIDLGNRVRAARAFRRWSQGDLGEAAEASVPTIVKIERGAETISLETLERVCRTLDIPFEVLVDGQALTQEAAA